MLELTSPEAPGADTRTPLDLALVIDRSGSMAGRKLEVTKACAAFLARRLAPTDRIALVTYDDEVRMLTPLAEPSPALATAIPSIEPGGSTNLDVQLPILHDHRERGRGVEERPAVSHGRTAGLLGDRSRRSTGCRSASGAA
jgi:Mg-chelatase subunit ChlD